DNLTIGGSFADYDGELVNAAQGSCLRLTGAAGECGDAGGTPGTVAGEDISGLVPNLVPQGTYTLYVDYNWQLANGSTIGLRADVRHRDTVWLRAGARDRHTLTQDGTRPLFQRPELDKIGASISWTNADEDLTIELWGRNLDDDYDWINSGPGSPFSYAAGILTADAPPGPPGTVRPRGYAGRKQVGITARFLF
nr:hypothetical protein [Gammaproteobacteria bacterium]